MPHFIIECNEKVLTELNAVKLVDNVFQSALSSGLFDISNIKVRIQPCDVFLVAGKKQNFIHVWGYIREGRSGAQKKQLSESIIANIHKEIVNVFSISCDIRELHNESYSKIQ